ncbi:type II toxin-antitoxin system VapC family toxin [Nonomuraea sp. K274]|uniref:Ribonuclease VapC n=1 Tax=Nonomuraea cypriaca TaxID=1187855 RepID=A0A931A849_9ACTN|nr:type II toxin-antitoxin system VapC family toxin [Nonomuraea cypriaca]MBF8186765.1 type II toxin-antitoxin system VapC family toxin [Nonomuraea cypriaca]
MLLADTNVLVNAFRHESRDHDRCHAFVREMVTGESSYAVCDFVVNGFIRMVTNRRIYKNAETLESALTFADTYRNQAQASVVAAGARHWEIFTRLSRQAGASGNLIPDVYLAALAIEHGCEFVTCDKDFARFQGLRWRSPLN